MRRRWDRWRFAQRSVLRQVHIDVPDGARLVAAGVSPRSRRVLLLVPDPVAGVGRP